MYLTRLTLTHYRNYRQIELDFHAPVTLIQGENAQGKTNLLEAVFMLATSKPIHAQSEREIVDWGAQEEPIPYSRIAGEVSDKETRRGGDKEQADSPPATRHSQLLEIILTPRGDGVNFKKQVKINGVGKRSLDLVGLMRAVLFMPEDLRLVDGSPSERRRYLDIALCQTDRAYTRALTDYQKVVEQRNSLLKSLREQVVKPTRAAIDAQLSFWDEKLVQHGSLIISKRHNFLQQVEAIAQGIHAELSGGREVLALHYLPSFNPGHLSDTDFQHLQDERATELVTLPAFSLSAEPVAAAFHAKLQSRRTREVDAGSTLYGPHRDDLRFVGNRRDLRTYGSRGQQRSAALSLKLAEVRVITALTGAAPLLLLDDVMSELDAPRRAALLATLNHASQVILTTTDWEDYSPAFRREAQTLSVRNGLLVKV